MKIKNSKRIRLLGRVLAIAMAVCLVLGITTIGTSAATVNSAVNDAKNGVVQVQVWFNDPTTAIEEPLHYGTGFLVNDTTVVTCQHVASAFPAEFYAEWAMQTGRTVEEVKDCLELRVMLYRGVYVKAKVRVDNPELDLAVLTLDTKISRTPLKLRDSDDVKQTEEAFAIGFPADLTALDGKETYDIDDISITTGNVDKIGDMSFMTESGTYNSVNCIESSARISGGNSGGPLVDKSGNVIGINAAGDDTRFIAISSKELITVLKALGIEYTAAGSGSVTVTPDNDNDKNNDNDKDTVADPDADDDKESAKDKKDDGASESSDNTMLIIIIAGAAVLVIVIIVVAISLGKKKKAPAVAAAPAPQYSQPVAPVAPVAPQQPQYSQPVPPAAPARPVAPVAPVVPAAGETTVLGGGETTVLGGGETTVLAQNINGGILTRTATGERITISSADFSVGRERSSVDYCVSGNTNISRVHARFIVRDGVTYIVDNKAANGTFVNGVKARAGQEIQLNNGDKIVLADEKFDFNK